jgi:uncharacterized protein (TIGR02246 family)
MSADRKAIIQHINAAFAENDLEKVLSFCTDDFIWTMVGDSAVKGKDAIRQWMASMDVEPPQELRIEQVIAEGDTVITRGDMMVKGRKEPAPHSYAFCDVYRFTGDKVAELMAFVIKTDQARAHEQTAREIGLAV